MARKTVADKKEALKSITEIMRGDEIKTADKMKAAEYIVKYEDEQAKRLDEEKREYGGDAEQIPLVMIVDDIPPDSGG